MEIHTKCPHQYDVSKYSRDDMGFYVDCIHCGETLFIHGDFESDLYAAFGLDDDDEDDEDYSHYNDDDDE